MMHYLIAFLIFACVVAAIYMGRIEHPVIEPDEHEAHVGYGNMVRRDE